MKQDNGFGRRLRFGSASLGITAAVLAVVILLNVLVSVLCSENLVFTDLTSESIYTLSDAAKNLLDMTLEAANKDASEDKPVKIDIIFCADRDMLYKTTMMRYVYYTALALEQAAPQHIRVRPIDVWENPSLVDDYRGNSYSTIYPTDIIVASGSEFRVIPAKNFYIYDSTDSTAPWAYSGEKKFLSAIIAVTRAESPICALTVGHGEPFDPKTGETEYTEFVKLIENAGYDIAYLDLEKDEIPENCRLIITFDPQKDFSTAFQKESGAVSEIAKLDKFLSNSYSFMVFVDEDTPALPALEEYLEEWGIVISRYSATENGVKTEGNLEVVDPGNSLDTEGSLIFGTYQPGGLGGSFTEDMRKTGNSPKVLFGNATALTYAKGYRTTHRLENTEKGIPAFTYGTYSNYNISRLIYDVFTTGDRSYAYAKAAGNRLTDDGGNDLVASSYDSQNPYRLMTVTSQNRTIGEGQGLTSVNDPSYVCAVASTDFASNAVLSTDSYGNADAIQGMLRVVGREIVPVGLKWVTLYDSAMKSSYYTATDVTVWTVVLVFLPGAVLTAAGIYVLVRRRFF